MENTLEVVTIHTPEELRTSSNNMMCIVTYEPLPENEQSEVEKIFQVAN